MWALIILMGASVISALSGCAAYHAYQDSPAAQGRDTGGIWDRTDKWKSFAPDGGAQ